MTPGIRTMLTSLMVVLAGVGALVLGLATLATWDRVAWQAMVSYAATEGPQVAGGDTVKSPPCVPGVVEDSSDIGSAEITTTKFAESAAAAAPQGQAAKETLIRDGWVDDQEGTGADVTYFSGTKTLRGRETFVSVEWWASDEVADQDQAEFVVRYLQFPISCGGIIWGPV